MYTFESLEKIINNSISNISFEEKPQSLFEPIKYSVANAGKRLRPVLTLMSANLYLAEINPVIKAAIALETFHNFTLLHDDLMDSSDLRRGVPTVHKKWNENVAILSGDAMLIKAYEMIAQVSHDKLADVLAIFTRTAMQVCQGQQLDMEFESRDDVTEEEYLNMIYLKTAVLIACSTKIGALLGDASATDADLLYDFGINIGMAFQLKDDLLDVYGDAKRLGKNIGGDIINNKKTFLLIKALKLSNPDQRKELDHWLSLSNFIPEEKVEKVRAIYDELHLTTISEELISKYYDAALNSLDKVNVTASNKLEIISLSNSLVNRDK